MINSLMVKGFKSIDNIKLKFNNLNLLVGVNSSGKSTIIQSLLLVSQNVSNSKPNLNGNLVSMGEFRELRNLNTNAKNVMINIEDNTGSCELFFDDSESSSRSNDFSKSNITFDKGLYYLSAARIGHMDTYEKNTKEIYKFGLQGEYCLSYFDRNINKVIDETLLVDNVSKTLGYNVNYWFDHIIGGRLNTEDIKQTDKLKAQFSGVSRIKVRTKNTGSGLSYLISIIIMCLSLEENETLIIENPEIHLHPKAQSRLTEFFIFISKANRQLIIETHSDHFFNGLRVAIANSAISNEEVSINFLSLDNRNCTINSEIKISKRGRIIDLPQDLFDQFEIDLDRMLGI
ncbi:DUF3696 domain-containing protein [Marinisporobacter balticus]|uniref:Putative ATPase n=1 Tax=Marinisporobacter balticus TaxID=2018667 RepID=A0A4R2K5V2_9FIRM|nr:DUF3696 domain-containing protein [Marinisporobacter balticus]TCO67894.1 putative ATPase [Marinisporobacter balticus]